MINIYQRILITGANGFVGANLVLRLVQLGCNNVHILLRETSDTWRIKSILDKVHIHYVSLSDRDALDSLISTIQPRIIYHLAAAGAYIGRNGSGMDVLIETNLLGTINLLNSCKNVGFDYFINTGSNSEYGEKDHPMYETDVLEPNNEYGVTKAAASMYCSYIGRKDQLPIYTFRLFAVYGFFEDATRLIPSVMVNYLQGKSPSLSRPTSVRDFIFIEDVVQYYLNIDNIHGDFGGVFNIGSGQQHTIGDVVSIIKNLAGSNLDPVYGMQALRQVEPTIWVSDMSKTHSVFSSVIPTKIEDGFLKSYQWLKDNLHYYVQ